MAVEKQQPGELALVKAVRSLDHKDGATIPDKLDQVWKILSIYAGGRFHAAEEMIVRWLLKNMNGNTADAEKLRRYPLTWRILGKVFSSIPLFSLAKSLADRRFVPILQNALKDASEPTDANKAEDTEMADADREDRPSKRQRADDVVFDLESQKKPSGCLKTAEAMFEALRLLLLRLEAKDENHMGAEHIKSLFCSSAEEIKDLIVRALLICKVAVTAPQVQESLEGQESWIATINNIWDLHLQGEGDAIQVAMHFANPAIDMLGKLAGVPRAWPIGVDDDVRDQWEQDLRRFLTRNLILPARTAYLNRVDMEIIRIAVRTTLMMSTLACPVIFDLVLSAPHMAGGQSAKRENELWAQAVFSFLEETLQPSQSKYKQAAVRIMMEKALKWDVVLSRESLRSFATSFAMDSGEPDWSLLLLIAKLNVDAFIAGDDEALFDRVVDLSMRAQELLEGDVHLHEAASSFIVTLAEGYAKARDLSGFVKKWYQNLYPHVLSESVPYRLWCNEKLSKTVAENLEKTLNTNQVIALLDWLDVQDQLRPQDAAIILILGAISRGITRDDVVDAVGLRLYNMACIRGSSPGDANAEVLDNYWAIHRRSVEWSTYEQVQEIWSRLANEVGYTLQPLVSTPSHNLRHQLETFKLAASAWIANHPGGAQEKEIGTRVMSFMFELYASCTSHGSDVAMSEDLFAEISRYWLCDCPQLLSLLLNNDYLKDKWNEKDNKKRFDAWLLDPLEPSVYRPGVDLSPAASSDVTMEESSRHKVKRVKSVIANENNLNERTVADKLRGACNLQQHPSPDLALMLPLELYSREHREEVMGDELLPLVRGKFQGFDKSDSRQVKAITSAMIKFMERPTFYPNMDFADIDYVAEIMAAGDKTVHEEYLPLLEELATRTIRQMTANVQTREESYFSKAALRVLDEWPVKPSEDLAFRIVLLKRLLMAIKQVESLQSLPDLDVGHLELRLYEMIHSAVDIFTSKPDDMDFLKAALPSLCVVLEATSALDKENVMRILRSHFDSLTDLSGKLPADGQFDFWKLRKFVVKSNAEEVKPLIKIENVLGPGLKTNTNASDKAQFANKDSMLECVDAVIEGMDEQVKLQHIRALLSEPSTGTAQLAKLLAVQRIIQQLEGTRTITATADKFDLAGVHTALCNRLRHSTSAVEFLLATQILQELLDDKWHHMTQWNIELTLSTVSTLSSEATTHPVISTTPKSYEALCRLLQVIIRRHRLRLDGHFHLLVTVLQSLLRQLIAHPYTTTSTTWTGGLIKDSSSIQRWEKHAKAYARLLTMVCEPSAASVSRGHHQTSLDSATDAAKRTAGQHMYLVLMLYIKLQLEQNVPHDVREAMEPGVFSVLDVTSPEGRRMMNDALDPSGRAIMKEMYKQYLKFGKWSGI